MILNIYTDDQMVNFFKLMVRGQLYMNEMISFLFHKANETLAVMIVLS